MNRLSLSEIADDQIALARDAEAGMSGYEVHDDGSPVQHTVLAMTAGQRIEVNHAPQHASALVISGRIVMRTADGPADGMTGDLFVVSGEPHSVTSREDSVLLITVSRS